MKGRSPIKGHTIICLVLLSPHDGLAFVIDKSLSYEAFSGCDDARDWGICRGMTR